MSDWKPEKDLSAPLPDGRFCIVAARFNEPIVNKLLDGARQALAAHGVPDNHVSFVQVPGAFEIPLIAKRIASSAKVDAVITLGAVIRGDTPHFEFVAGEAARGCTLAALDSGVPVIFGVLTTDNVEQAFDRCGGSAGNKGYEAAVTAIEMVHTLRALREQGL